MTRLSYGHDSNNQVTVTCEFLGVGRLIALPFITMRLTSKSLGLSRFAFTKPGSVGAFIVRESHKFAPAGQVMCVINGAIVRKHEVYASDSHDDELAAMIGCVCPFALQEWV